MKNFKDLANAKNMRTLLIIGLVKKVIVLAFIFVPQWLSAQSDYHHRRKGLFELLPITSKDIVFVGNSITDGGQWDELFQNPNVKNRGISGDKTQDVLARMDQVTKGKPKKIFLLIGTNDLSGEVESSNVRDAAANIGQIIDKVKSESPKTKLYVQSVMPVKKERPGKNAQINSLNAEIKKMCEDKGITYVDIHTTLADSDGALRQEYTNDGLHLTGKGYVAWANAIRSLVDPKSKAMIPAPTVEGLSAKASLFEELPITSKDIVFVGNSITAAPEWNEIFHNPNIKNRGIGGNTTSQVLERLYQITRGQPKKVFLLIGINDLKYPEPERATTVVTNIGEIIDRIKTESPKTKIYVQSILPVSNAENRENHNRGLRVANPLIKKLCEEKGVTFIDTYAALADSDGYFKKEYTREDGVHLTAEGNMALAKVLRPYVK